MGDGAGAPTPAQLEKMKELVATAMRAGAVGIATALIYPPDSFQSTQDLIELAKVAAQYNGIYASHMRDESAALLSAIGESIQIGEQAGIQVEVFHFKGAYQPGWGQLVPQALALIDGARARGVNIGADMYLYAAGGTGLDITVPNWVWERGVERGLKQLRSPRVRERLKRELQAGSQPGWSNLVHASGGWDHVVLANAFSERYDAYRYKSIEDIGRQLNRDPADVAWDILLEAAPKRAMALFFMMSEGDIETALKAPWMAIGSDAAATERLGEMDALGLPHPRSYGNFPRADRRVRAQAQGAHAGGRRAQAVVAAGDAHAAVRPRGVARRTVGGPDDLRFRSHPGQRDVREPGRSADGHRLRAGQRPGRRRRRQAHRSEAGQSSPCVTVGRASARLFYPFHVSPNTRSRFPPRIFSMRAALWRRSASIIASVASRRGVFSSVANR